MNSIVFLGETTDLCHGEKGGEDGMIGEENIIKVNFACLFIIDEVSIRIVDGIESKPSKIHGDKIEVHTLDTTEKEEYLLRLKF